MKNVFFVFFLSIFIAQGVFAEDLNFITLEVSPWASINPETGEPEGVFPLVVREFEKRSGHKINITLTPFARIQRELESGRQDCTILVTNAELARVTEQGKLLSHHAIGVIARKGLVLSSYDDLNPLTISVLRGSNVSAKFDNDSSLKKEFDTNYSIGLRKLSHNRLDAIFGAIPTIRYLAAQEGYSDLLGDDLVLEDVPLLLQCSKRSPNLKLMPLFNQAISDMHKDGTIAKIKKDYYF
ncbi:MAG: polar amino acid transport system substrate-binding protein [Flavobacteriales bacterium]|jgi:polar amino acid transport system substrate-binding protein